LFETSTNTEFYILCMRKSLDWARTEASRKKKFSSIEDLPIFQ